MITTIYRWNKVKGQRSEIIAIKFLGLWLQVLNLGLLHSNVGFFKMIHSATWAATSKGDTVIFVFAFSWSHEALCFVAHEPVSWAVIHSVHSQEVIISRVASSMLVLAIWCCTNPNMPPTFLQLILSYRNQYKLTTTRSESKERSRVWWGHLAEECGLVCRRSDDLMELTQVETT